MKRKGDVCSSLGRHFKQFFQSALSEQYLFDEPAMKRIRAETGQALKRPKEGYITRATAVTINNNKRHINPKTRERVIKIGNF